MCCFSLRVRFVGSTKIFARGLPDGRQLLAYSMDVEVERELAMVLPLPVPRGCGDDAVEFLSLDGYDRFFDDLAAAFPPSHLLAPQAKSRSPLAHASPPKLVVHEVGQFEASFVPSRADFARLDERFRMPEEVFQEAAEVRDYGFAVFRLKPKKRGLLGFFTKRQRVHPMAFSFPRRNPGALFFPLLHAHDGRVPSTAAFDHLLYAQPDPLLRALLPWIPSSKALDVHVDTARARGLVAEGEPGCVLPVFGQLPNADWSLEPPAGIRLDDLAGSGLTHRYELSLTTALQPPTDDARFRLWHENGRRHAPALVRFARSDLPALCERKRMEWRLTELAEDLPQLFVNGRQLWTGTSYQGGGPADPGGPGRVRIRVFGTQFEPQLVELGFASLPGPNLLAEILEALSACLDGAVGGHSNTTHAC